MSEIILLFTIWLVSGDKLTEQHEKPFASTMECTLAGQIEALKKVKEYEAQGKEVTVHFTCAPKIDERQCERLDSPPFTAGSFFVYRPHSSSASRLTAGCCGFLLSPNVVSGRSDRASRAALTRPSRPS